AVAKQLDLEPCPGHRCAACCLADRTGDPTGWLQRYRRDLLIVVEHDDAGSDVARVASGKGYVGVGRKHESVPFLCIGHAGSEWIVRACELRPREGKKMFSVLSVVSEGPPGHTNSLYRTSFRVDNRA